MTTRHATNDDLRAALTAAIPGMTEDQARVASVLLDALNPPMQEPTWPGAPVIAGCGGTALRRLHTRRNDGPTSGWECAYSCDTTAFERDRATAWLTTAAGIPENEAARVIRKLSTAVGTRNGVRVLDTLLSLGWRPGGER